jgi:hypothetical protein
MKLFLTGVLLSLSFLFNGAVCAQGPADRVKETFAQAVEAYKKGDYETAVRLNSSILAAGVESAALHYNLGNSYLRSRQIGRAIASYLRAQRLSPGDVDVLANLNYARSMVSAPPSAGKKQLWAVPFERLSVDELRWGALFIFMFSATVVLVGLYAGWKRRKVWAWGIAGGLLSVYMTVGVFSRLAVESVRGVCVVTAEVKFEPAPQATTYYKLPEGSEVRILREKEGWLKIERSDHKAGWVTAGSISRV